MNTNPLVDGKKPMAFKSAYRAAQWAASARERGLTKIAEAWDKAGLEGWDDEHYDPNRLEEIRRKIGQSRR